jgi:DNA-binding MarR family transcriptional regulator
MSLPSVSNAEVSVLLRTRQSSRMGVPANLFVGAGRWACCPGACCPSIISLEFLVRWIVDRFSIMSIVSKMSRSPSDRASDSESLVDAFGRLMPVFKRWLELKYEKGTMSYARLKLIGMLHAKGPMIMSELGARLDVSARNITKLVDALEQEGLVRRVAHCTDRRATVIETTPEGSKVGEKVWGEHRKAMSTLFDELSERDRADLLRTVTRLHAVLERRMSAGGLSQPWGGEEGCAAKGPTRPIEGESGS